jgi:hypothetical protein
MSGHVARMGRRGMRIRYWRDNWKEIDNEEDVSGWIILKWILKR